MLALSFFELTCKNDGKLIVLSACYRRDPLNIAPRHCRLHTLISGFMIDKIFLYLRR